MELTPYRRRMMLVGVATAACVLLALATWRLAVRADQTMREELLQQTRLVARMIDAEEIRSLSGTMADLDAPLYHRLKRRLARAVLAREHCRFIYLMGRNDDGTIFFFVDDVAIGDPDEIFPGDIYDEAPESFRAVFDQGSAVTVGPFSDRWGTYVSGAAPISDPETGQVLAVLGFDIDAAEWRSEVMARTALPASLLAAVCILIVSALLAHYSRSASLGSVRRSLMPPLFGLVVVLVVGMALGALALGRQRKIEIGHERLRVAAVIWQLLHEEHVNSVTGLARMIGDSPIFRVALAESDHAALERLAEQVHHRHDGDSDGEPSWMVIHSPDGTRDLFRSRGAPSKRSALAFRVLHPILDDDGAPLAQLVLGCDPAGLLSVFADRLNPQAIEILALPRERSDDRDQGIIYSSMEDLPKAIRHGLDAGDGQPAPPAASWGSWQVKSMPLPTAPGSEGMIADLMILHNVDRLPGGIQPHMVLLIALGIVLTAGLTGLIHILLLRTDRGIDRQQADLRKIGQRLNATLLSIGDAVIAADLQGRVTLMNPVAERLCGWTLAEASGRPLDTVFVIRNGRTGAPAANPVARVLDTGETVGLANDTALITRDGSSHQIADSAAPIYDAAGTVSGVVLVFRDVSEIYRLRERERFRLDFQREVAHISSRFVTMAEDALDATIDLALADLGQLFEADRCYIFRYSDDGRHMTNTHEWCRAGTQAYINNLQDLPVDSLPWWYEQISGLQVVHVPTVAELPDEARTERELLQSQQIQSLVCLPLLDGQRAAIGFFGMDMVRQAYRWEDEQIAMLQVVGEIIAGAIANTEHRRRILAELRGSAEEIAAVNELLSQQQDRLVQMQKMEAIGQLAAGVAHEINTPIQFVGDNVRFLKDAFTDLLGANDRLEEMLARDAAASGIRMAVSALNEEIDLDFLRAEIPQAITQTIEGVERVATIVQAMKEFAHRGGGEMVPADLNRAIDSTLVISRNEYKYTADIKTQLDPDLPPVVCDIDAIKQVILNLVVNAAQAIQDHLAAQSEEGQRGLIQVSTQREQDAVILRVQDDGGGIPEEIHQRIFEPFFTTKEVGRGSGQGLPLVHKVVVAQHRGAIDVKSTVGVGTSFIIRLPLEPPEDEESRVEILARHSGIRPALGSDG